MPKNWWFKFEQRVWQSDPALSKVSLAARGFWLEMICMMHSEETYTISGTFEEIGRMARCESAEVAKYALELKDKKAANVTLGNGTVTLLSRRLKREVSAREQTRLRVQRARGNADVTQAVTDRVRSKSNKKEVREEEEREDATNVASTQAIAKRESLVSEEEGDKGKKATRGTRLPEPFYLTSEMRAYALDKRPTLDAETETEKFVNYWRAKPGRDGTKLDWLATWRVWILNAKENHNGTNRQNNGRSTTAQRIADHQPILAEYPTEAELGRQS